MAKKQTVAILFGGKSVEHQISINSATNIHQFIDKNTYEVELVGISQNGSWYHMPGVSGDFSKGQPISFSLEAHKKGFTNIASGKLISPDIIFPVLHGTDGEDGSIQGMLTSMEIPFVGTGVLGSAISMNKLYSKRLLEAAGIPSSKYVAYTSASKETISYGEMALKLGVPFMAKAANLGSSVGIFKISDEPSFSDAVTAIFEFDNTLICEQFVDGRELECSVMGNLEPEASMPAEIIVSEDYEFYTYEAKYLDPDAAKLQVPADIDPDIAEQIRDFSIAAYTALHCEDFARVDLFLKDDGTILINEINTIPGFTNSSMFPMMWKERGISFTTLITRLIEMALDRFKTNQELIKVYKP